MDVPVQSLGHWCTLTEPGRIRVAVGVGFRALGWVDLCWVSITEKLPASRLQVRAVRLPDIGHGYFVTWSTIL